MDREKTKFTQLHSWSDHGEDVAGGLPVAVTPPGGKRARRIAAARVRWAIARQRGYHLAAAYRIWWERGWWVAAPGAAAGYLAGATAVLAAATVSEVEELAA